MSDTALFLALLAVSLAFSASVCLFVHFIDRDAQNGSQEKEPRL